MNGVRFWGALVVAAVLGGLGGGLVGARLTGSDGKPETAPTKEEVREQGPEDQGADREGAERDGEDGEVQALRGRLASLERRISLLTAAMSRGEAVPEGEEGEAGQNPREADVADPVFEAAVLDIMDRERERAEGERETRRAELRAERTQRLSDGLAETLGLDPQQKEQVTGVISQHFDAFRELRADDNPDRPITPRQWRAKADELEQKLHQNLASVLTPKQMAAYRALDPDDQITTRFGGTRSRTEPRSANSATVGQERAR